jgi:small subunit ribosomal protein S20
MRGGLANIKQQKKRILVAQRQRQENLRYRSAIKTFFRRLQAQVDAGDAEATSAEHTAYVKLVDRAAAQRALHPNTAARKKSRAARLVARGAVEAAPARKTRAKAGAKAAAAKARTTAKSKSARTARK